MFGLVLFWPCASLTGLDEAGILPLWVQTERKIVGIDEDDVNRDPSPLGKCT